MPDGVDPARLDQTGWGVVFPHCSDPAWRKALDPLIEWRRSQAAAINPKRFRILEGVEGYHWGQTRFQFLDTQNGSHDIVDPSRLPYHLLLVGPPTAIPFPFQYQLDIQHSVGRVDFDTPEELASYAARLVATEKSTDATARNRRMVVFCPTDEKVAERILQELATPVVDRLLEQPAPDWTIEPVFGPAASRAELARWLEEPPDLLLTTGHGCSANLCEADQREKMGGLWCHDAPFFATDLRRGRPGRQFVMMSFACFGAGTEAQDEFERHVQLAEKPFTARLPQRLLGDPAGGALAFIGHVGRSWTTSFTRRSEAPSEGATGRTSQVEPFVMMVRRLQAGLPVGFALEPFNLRHAEMTAELAYLRNFQECGGEVDDVELRRVLFRYLDARNFVVLGDPAARML